MKSAVLPTAVPVISISQSKIKLQGFQMWSFPPNSRILRLFSRLTSVFCIPMYDNSEIARRKMAGNEEQCSKCSFISIKSRLEYFESFCRNRGSVIYLEKAFDFLRLSPKLRETWKLELVANLVSCYMKFCMEHLTYCKERLFWFSRLNLR